MENNIDRPSWDGWFLALAFLVSRKSIDPDTKHGSIIVDENKNILSVGFNSPPRGCDDYKLDLTRPMKYELVQHAEQNAITNAAYAGSSLKNATIYVTGQPCHRCLGIIINAGIRKVYYGPKTSKCINQDAVEMIMNGQVELIPMHTDVCKDALKTLKDSYEYLKSLGNFE